MDWKLFHGFSAFCCGLKIKTNKLFVHCYTPTTLFLIEFTAKCNFFTLGILLFTPNNNLAVPTSKMQ